MKNRLYFACVAMFVMVGGLFTFFFEKGGAILYFNDFHTAWADIFFKYATKLGEEPVYVIVFLLYLGYRLRYSLLVAITGFSVMGVSYITKLFFGEDRPLAFFRKLNQEDVLNLVDGVKVYTGHTSFPSGHSMSAFALYSLLALLLPPRKRLGALLFITAFTVAFSRIYLVQHFLRDIYAGSLVGVALAILIHWANSHLEYRPGNRIDQP
ncbi:MAG: phosphatase PAP2 family protein, partial [Saprospiraceae bacterium]